MWVRRLLRELYGLEERSAHTPGELDWERLPERCVVQIHWRRTAAFPELLARHGFRPVVVARHPLDVLVSILHFARHEPATAQWLDGEGGDESRIIAATPTSRSFRRYATGSRARALLSVSPEWWDATDSRVRYEELVQRPEDELDRVAATLGEPVVSPARALERVTFGKLQNEAANNHFWRGAAEGWRGLLPTQLALKIARAQAPALNALGYSVDPDPALDEQTAEIRWSAMAAPRSTSPVLESAA